MKIIYLKEKNLFKNFQNYKPCNLNNFCDPASYRTQALSMKVLANELYIIDH